MAEQKNAQRQKSRTPSDLEDAPEKETSPKGGRNPREDDDTEEDEEE